METTIVKRTSIEGKIINPENHNLRTLDDSNSSLYNPCDETLDEDPDNTMNSDCNITVIHVPLKPNNNNDSTSSDTKYEDDINNTSLTTTAIELDKKDYSNDGKDSKDGSDSGVEGCAIEVPRIQSRNSVDYASSCNGLDEASCDSSLASYCSVYEDPCGGNLPEDFRLSNGTVGEGTSEAGSESSSLAGSIQNTSNVTMTRSVKLTSVTDNCNKIVQPKKKVLQISTSHGSSLNIVGSSSISIKKTPRQNALTLSMTTITSSALTTTVTTTNSLCSSTITSRARAAISRTQSNAKDRGRSRDPGPTRTVTASTVASRSRSRPSTLPSALTSEINRDLAQRSKINATSKTNKVVISSTKSHQTIKDDSINRKSTLTSVNHKPSNNKVELKNFKSFDKMSASSDSRTLDTYATLPRSKHKLSISKVVDKSNEKDKLSLVRRSRSGSRDASLSRHLGRRSLLPKEINSNLNRTKESLSPTTKEKLLAKTKIYHEISIQTGITGEDIENVLAGVITTLPNPESVEKSDKETETEGSWEELQSTKADLKRVSETANELKQENDKLKSEIEFLKQKLSEEKSDHQFVRTELDKKNQRVMAMLGTPQSEQSEANDSFLELENHLQSSGQVLANQQVEISDLQALCRMLKRDLEKSIAAHDLLLQQQQEMESESAEIQDFLQEEKAALETALRDTEAESKKKDDLIKQLSSDLERQTEECKHLVRISEQRRQENLSISMRLNAIERKTRELLLGQGATVSGASVALSGLSSRLEGLVDQLINSYNISAKDLEDVIYHNEAFSRSNSSIDSSPVSSKHSLKDHTPSPKRGSFVSAIIGAIRNAATNSFTNLHNYENTASSISRNSKKRI